MFDRVGKNIMIFAMALCWLGIIGSILVGSYMMIDGAVLVGLLVILFGTLFSWVGTSFTYAFGQLVDNTDTIVSCLNSNSKHQDTERTLTAIKARASVERKSLDEDLVDSWCCICGKVQPGYVSSCSCGVNKRDVN